MQYLLRLPKIIMINLALTLDRRPTSPALCIREFIMIISEEFVRCSINISAT